MQGRGVCHEDRVQREGRGFQEARKGIRQRITFEFLYCAQKTWKYHTIVCYEDFINYLQYEQNLNHYSVLTKTVKRAMLYIDGISELAQKNNLGRKK